MGTSSNLILAVEVNSTEVDKSNGREFMTWKKKKKLRGDQKGQVTRKQLHWIVSSTSSLMHPALYQTCTHAEQLKEHTEILTPLIPEGTSPAMQMYLSFKFTNFASMAWRTRRWRKNTMNLPSIPWAKSSMYFRTGPILGKKLGVSGSENEAGFRRCMSKYSNWSSF